MVVTESVEVPVEVVVVDEEVVTLVVVVVTSHAVNKPIVSVIANKNNSFFNMCFHLFAWII